MVLEASFSPAALNRKNNQSYFAMFKETDERLLENAVLTLIVFLQVLEPEHLCLSLSSQYSHPAKK